MSKAFVVFVSLFIRLSSGFIVPSSVSEAPNNVILRKINNSKENTSESNLENNIKIHENELLYHSVEDKTKSVNERSFIFINKKYWPQFNSPLYKTPRPEIVQTLKDVQTNGRLSQMYHKVKPGLLEDNSLQQQFFLPNTGQRNQLHNVPLKYVYEYPNPPTNHRNYPSVQLDPNQIIQEHTTTVMPIISKPVEKYDDRHFELQLPHENLKIVDNTNENPSKTNTKTIASNKHKPPKKMRITSYTQRKPNNNYHSCGFLKPNQLHRASFSKKQDYSLGEAFSPIQIDGPNLDPSFGSMYDDEEDKLERYIKETLMETKIRLHKNQNNPRSCDGNIKNQDGNEVINTNEQFANLHSKQDESAEIIENTNLEDIVVPIKNKRVNLNTNDSKNELRGLNHKNISDDDIVTTNFINIDHKYRSRV